MRIETAKKTKSITKLIKAELKIAFPKTKFSVTGSNFGGTVRIDYADNFVKRSEVSECIEKFRAGKYDGMDDSYVYKKDNTKHPRADYIMIFNYVDA